MEAERDRKPDQAVNGVIAPGSSLFYLFKKKAVNADDKHDSVLAAALSLEKVSSSELKEVVDMKSANYPLTTQNPNSTNNATATVTVSEPGPTTSGTTGTCYKWYVIKDGEY